MACMNRNRVIASVALVVLGAAPIAGAQTPGNSPPEVYGDRQQGHFGDPGDGYFGNPAEGHFGVPRQPEDLPPQGAEAEAEPTAAEDAPFLILNRSADDEAVQKRREQRSGR